MTFEEYDRTITTIHDELQTIATRTANHGLAGVPDPSNPVFVTLMQRHAQLIKFSTELTERMFALMKRQRN